MPLIQPDHTTVNHSNRTQVAVEPALRLPADWDLLVSAPVNVLLIGGPVTTSALADAMRPHLVQPLVDCHDTLNLPSVGTAILSDVDGLVLADQQRLNTWLAHAEHRPRLITTSRVSVFPMIAAGMFIESLYYRLNTLCIDLTGGPVER